MPADGSCHDSEVELNMISETNPTKTDITEIPNIQSKSLGADPGPVPDSKSSGTAGSQEVLISLLISLYILL